MHAQVDFIKNVRTSNILGTLPGETNDEILLFAHLDTVYNSEGANDNTATVIILLMLAHALSGIRRKNTVTFMATTGEEYDYLGTRHYAEVRKNEGSLNRLKFVANFDSLTWGPNLTLITKEEIIVKTIEELYGTLGLLGAPLWRDSDGLGREASPLKNAGLECRGLVVDSGGYDHNPVWHRPEDTTETVPRDCIENSFLILSEFFKRVMEGTV